MYWLLVKCKTDSGWGAEGGRKVVCMCVCGGVSARGAMKTEVGVGALRCKKQALQLSHKLWVQLRMCPWDEEGTDRQVAGKLARQATRRGHCRWETSRHRRGVHETGQESGAWMRICERILLSRGLPCAKANPRGGRTNKEKKNPERPRFSMGGTLAGRKLCACVGAAGKGSLAAGLTHVAWLGGGKRVNMG